LILLEQGILLYFLAFPLLNERHRDVPHRALHAHVTQLLSGAVMVGGRWAGGGSSTGCNSTSWRSWKYWLSCRCFGFCRKFNFLVMAKSLLGKLLQLNDNDASQLSKLVLGLMYAFTNFRSTIFSLSHSATKINTIKLKIWFSLKKNS